MSNSATPTRDALAIRLENRGVDQMLWSAIGASVFPGASDESKLMALDYCKSRGLDILKKPCHIVPMNVKDAKTGQYSWRDVIMPGIAEQRITASRTGQYAGQDPPVFGPTVELKIGNQTHQVPEFCTVTVYRISSNGIKMAFSNTEYFEEACGTVKDGSLNSMWTKRKRGQLSKCAEAGALRKAFPEETGGITTLEELAGHEEDETIRQTTGRVVPTENPFLTNDSAPSAATEAPKRPKTSKPAPEKAPATEATAEPELEATAEPAEEMPSRDQMLADFHAACAKFNVSPSTAAKAYKAYGAIPSDKKMGDLFDEELFQVWKVREIALEKKGEQAP